MSNYRLLNKVVSSVKGETFELDATIPFSYLLRFFFRKLVMFICAMLKLHSCRFAFVHPSARILCVSMISYGRNLSIERGCYIDALSKNGIRFGNNVSIGKNTTIECTGTLKDLGRGISIGNNVGLGTHGFFGCAGGIVIGDDTIFGNYVSLHSENHNFDEIITPIRLQGVNRKGITIGKNCWIGAKVTILDGANIGDGCIIAAGAVVRGIIMPNSIVGGIPARVIKIRK